MAKELDEAVGAFRPACSTPDRTHSSPPTRWRSRSVKSAESSGYTPWLPPGSTPRATERSSVFRSPPPRTARAGWPSSETWWHAACPGPDWSPVTHMPAWSPPNLLWPNMTGYSTH